MGASTEIVGRKFGQSWAPGRFSDGRVSRGHDFQRCRPGVCMLLPLSTIQGMPNATATFSVSVH